MELRNALDEHVTTPSETVNVIVEQEHPLFQLVVETVPENDAELCTSAQLSCRAKISEKGCWACLRGLENHRIKSEAVDNSGSFVEELGAVYIRDSANDSFDFRDLRQWELAQFVRVRVITRVVRLQDNFVRSGRSPRNYDSAEL